MGELGSAIGAGLGAIGRIFGGIAASKAMRNVKNNLKEQRARNLDWYNRRYNEDPTQRASAQAVYSMLTDSIRNRNRQAAGTQAVMGGTEESVAATKAANNEAMAQAMTNIAVSGDARRDAIESTYLETDANIQKELNDLERQKAGYITQATKGTLETGNNIAGII